MCLRATVQTESVQGRMDLLESILPWTCKAFFKAAGNVKIFQGEERPFSYVMDSGDDPLESFSLCYCAAGKPHTDTVA